MEVPLVYDVQQQHVSVRARVPLMFGVLEARPEGRINMDNGQYRYRNTLCACVGPQLRSGHNGSRLRVEAGIGASSDNNGEGFLTIGIRKVTGRPRMTSQHDGKECHALSLLIASVHQSLLIASVHQSCIYAGAARPTHATMPGHVTHMY